MIAPWPHKHEYGKQFTTQGVHYLKKKKKVELHLLVSLLLTK